MRHVHGRHRQALLQLDELGAGLHAQLRVEVREGLVHEVDLRVADDRAAHRDALPLPAGELARFAVEVRLEVEQPCDVAHALHPFLFRDSLLLEREAHVLCDVEVGIERIVLKHHCDVACPRRNARDIVAADEDPAIVERFEPGQHPERGRLARSGRPDEHEQLAVGDRKVQLVHGRLRRPRVEPRRLLVLDGRHVSASSHLSAPIESPRIIRFWVAQPASTTGRQARTEAADSFARKFPRVDTFEITHCGIVDPFAKFSWSA